MKTHTQLFLGVSLGSALLVGCKPSGPVTASEMSSLTNATRKVTSDPILRIDHVDAETRMMVSVGSTTNHHDYLFERTTFGWKYVPAISKP
jgi:hypothetical protein